MNKLVKLILDKNLNEAKEVFQTEMLSIVERKLVEAKKMAAAKDTLVVRKAFDGSQGARAEKLYRDVVEEVPVLEGEYDEALDEAQRVKIVKARIRGGKVQRRKRVSNVKGFTLRGGRLTRMSAAERRRRKMGQRRGKIKRRAKMNRILMKRQRSLRKRASIGLK